jgi:hypothetical protein
MLLILPAGALGGPPSRGSDRGVFVGCEFLTSNDGTLFFGGFLSEVNGTSAGLEAFGPGGEPFVYPPTFVTSPDEDPTGSQLLERGNSAYRRIPGQRAHDQRRTLRGGGGSGRRFRDRLDQLRWLG